MNIEVARVNRVNALTSIPYARLVHEFQVLKIKTGNYVNPKTLYVIELVIQLIN